MKIGFTYSYFEDGEVENDIIALQKEGCEKIIQFNYIKGERERSLLDRIKDSLYRDDTLVVYSNDRLGIQVVNFIRFLLELEGMGIHYKSLSEPCFNTETNRQFLVICRNFIDMKDSVYLRDTRVGLAKAKLKGVVGGRIKGDYDKVAARKAKNMYLKGIEVEKIVKILNKSRATIYRYLSREGVTTCYRKSILIDQKKDE